MELADDVLFGGAVEPKVEAAEKEKLLIVSASKSNWEEGASSKIEFVFFPCFFFYYYYSFVKCFFFFFCHF